MSPITMPIVHQDISMYVGLISANESISFEPQPDRFVWLHVAQGEISIDDRHLSAGDAIAYSHSGQNLTITSPTNAEIILFDLK